MAAWRSSGWRECSWLVLHMWTEGDLDRRGVGDPGGLGTALGAGGGAGRRAVFARPQQDRAQGDRLSWSGRSVGCMQLEREVVAGAAARACRLLLTRTLLRRKFFGLVLAPGRTLRFRKKVPFQAELG